MVQLEQKYIYHLIKEHLAPLQRSIPSPSCQYAIVGDFSQSPIPASFRDLHSPILSGPASPPPLKSCSSQDSFVSFWEELNAIVGAEVPTIKQEGGSSHEVEAPTLQTSEEAWEDVSKGSAGGSSEGGMGNA